MRKYELKDYSGSEIGFLKIVSRHEPKESDTSTTAKWSAEIHVENQHIRLGMFSNFEDAVKAREEAELKYYVWNKQ